MRSYAEQHLPEPDIELFRRIKLVVEAMPDVDLGKDGGGNAVDVSCHMLARAIANFFPVQCRDGYFRARGWPHSWLVTPHENIIDVYPWAAVGGPTLVVGERFSPWRSLFQETKLPLVKSESFARRVGLVTQAVRETIQRLNIKAA